MFAPTYFPPDYFPKTYFPSGGVSAPSTGSYFPQTYFEESYFTPFYFPGSGIGVTPIVYADIWEALVAYVDATVPAVLGGIHADRAPNTEADGTPKVFPFYVYGQGTGGTSDYMTGTPQIVTGAGVIAIYNLGSKVQSNLLARRLAARLKDAPLLFEDGNLMYFRSRVLYQGTLDPDPGPNGEDVYQSVVEFDYQYHN